MRKILLITATCLITFVKGYASQTLTYDDIRQAGGFNVKNMKSVCYIMPSDNELTSEEINQLVKSDKFKKLHTLDLSNQINLTNEHITFLVKNPAFSRLNTILLSDCINISDISIKAILDSDCIGSIRELPQISGSCGLPASEVYINVSGTSVSGEEKKKATRERKKDNFKISYRPSNPNVFYPTARGVKFVELSY